VERGEMIRKVRHDAFELELIKSLITADSFDSIIEP